MRILSYQTLFKIPLPPGQLVGFQPEPVRFDFPDLKQPTGKRAALFASGLQFVPMPPNQLQALQVAGWTIQYHQPQHPRREKWASTYYGDSGNEAVFVPPVAQTPPVGYDPIHIYPRRTPRQAMLQEPMPVTPIQGWVNDGWELQPPQPPHPRVEKSGSLITPVTIESLLTSFTPMGWAVQDPQPPHPRPERGAAHLPFLALGTPLLGFVAMGWEVAPHQPQHPRREKWGSVAPLSNVEAVFVPPPPATFPMSWLPPEHTYRHWLRPQLQWSTQPDDALRAFFAAGWAIQDPQPPHPRPEKSAALVTPVSIDAVLQPPNYQSGWEIAPHQPQHLRIERSAALVTPVSIEATYQIFHPAGWEFQLPHTPGQTALRQRTGGLAPWCDGGHEFTLLGWVNDGWEILPFQPPHPRPEKTASLLRGIDGTDLPFLAHAQLTWVLDPAAPAYRWPRKPTPFWDDGTQLPFFFTRVAGWEIQPPHIRPRWLRQYETSDHGQPAFLEVHKNWGFLAELPVVPHPRPERFGALMIESDGSVFQLHRQGGGLVKGAALAPFSRGASLAATQAFTL